VREESRIGHRPSGLATCLLESEGSGQVNGEHRGAEEEEEGKGAVREHIGVEDRLLCDGPDRGRQRHRQITV
jgi:hypothetical protein